MRIVALALLLSSCGDPCAWQIERGFEQEFHNFNMECLWDHQRATQMEEICKYKAANRGLVKWVCE